MSPLISSCYWWYSQEPNCGDSSYTSGKGIRREEETLDDVFIVYTSGYGIRREETTILHQTFHLNLIHGNRFLGAELRNYIVFSWEDLIPKTNLNSLVTFQGWATWTSWTLRPWILLVSDTTSGFAMFATTWRLKGLSLQFVSNLPPHLLKEQSLPPMPKPTLML